MFVTLEKAKMYLRVDSDDENDYIGRLITMSEKMVRDIGRIDDDICRENPELIENAVLYAVGYMFEHREEANHKEMTETLKYLLFQIRKEAF